MIESILKTIVMAALPMLGVSIAATTKILGNSSVAQFIQKLGLEHNQAFEMIRDTSSITIAFALGVAIVKHTGAVVARATVALGVIAALGLGSHFILGINILKSLLSVFPVLKF